MPIPKRHREKPLQTVPAQDRPAFLCWPACMTGPNDGPYGAGCEAFDFEFDDDVDTKDFARIQAVFMIP